MIISYRHRFLIVKIINFINLYQNNNHDYENSLHVP